MHAGSMEVYFISFFLFLFLENHSINKICSHISEYMYKFPDKLFIKFFIKFQAGLSIVSVHLNAISNLLNFASCLFVFFFLLSIFYTNLHACTFWNWTFWNSRLSFFPSLSLRKDLIEYAHLCWYLVHAVV